MAYYQNVNDLKLIGTLNGKCFFSLRVEALLTHILLNSLAINFFIMEIGHRVYFYYG
jgi:hypothetical protein